MCGTWPFLGLGLALSSWGLGKPSFSGWWWWWWGEGSSRAGARPFLLGVEFGPSFSEFRGVALALLPWGGGWQIIPAVRVRHSFLERWLVLRGVGVALPSGSVGWPSLSGSGGWSFFYFFPFHFNAFHCVSFQIAFFWVTLVSPTFINLFKLHNSS